jgi:uncharacterized protein
MASKPQGLSSWLPDVLSGLALASGIGYLAASYTLSRWLTRPTRKPLEQTPEDLGLTWEALACRSSDGFPLVGWTVSPPRPRATVLLCHGLRNHRGQTLERTAFLAGAGYRCVAFDHRAHGQSGGKRSSFGFYEGRDVLAVREHLHGRWPNEPWAALGISMGAAALCFAAEHTPPWHAVILESLYHDIDSAFSKRIGTKYPAWFRKFSRGVIWMTEKRLGVSLDQVAPVQHIAALAPAPLLLLTGDADELAPPEDSQRLLDRYPGPRELYLVAGAQHENVCEKGGEPYRQRVLGFLERWLPPEPR